jgi:phage FluMu gp28-like protein
MLNLKTIKALIAKTLYPYQRDWIQDRSQNVAIMAARQTGKSHTMALMCVYAALEANYDTDVVVVAQSHDHSKDAILDAAKWVDIISKIDGKLFDATVKSQAIILNRSDGITTRIIALASNPDTIRGYSCELVVLDEMAFHTIPEASLDSCAPMTSQTGGRILVCSTPKSDSDMFWRIMSGKQPGWSTHTLTIEQAIMQGYVQARTGKPPVLADLRASMSTQEAYDCEYMLVPLSIGSSFFSRDLIEACVDRGPLLKGPKYGGYDVARSDSRGDLSCFATVVRGDSGVFQCTRIFALEKGTDFIGQEQKALELFRSEGWQRIGVDSTGLGIAMVDRLNHLIGAQHVEPVLFSVQSKHDLLVTLKGLMEQGKLMIPDDEVLKDELASMYVEISKKTGQITYKSSMRSGHADRLMALCLAVRAANKPLPQKTGPAVTGGVRNQTRGFV